MGIAWSEDTYDTIQRQPRLMRLISNLLQSLESSPSLGKCQHMRSCGFASMSNNSPARRMACVLFFLGIRRESVQKKPHLIFLTSSAHSCQPGGPYIDYFNSSNLTGKLDPFKCLNSIAHSLWACAMRGTL